MVSGEIVPANFYFSNTAFGVFTTGAHWYVGVAPAAGSTALIRSGHNINLNTSIALANLTISGGTFTGSDGSARTLTINAAGTFTNNGIVTPTATGAVAFAGSGTFAGTSTISLTNFSFADKLQKKRR